MDGLLKALFSISSLIVAGLLGAIVPTNAQVNVTQYHNHSSRDGLYIDSAFTQSAAANLTRDLNFNGTIVGNVYAQPLYIEGGPSGPMVIAVTESNNVYALNAAIQRQRAAIGIVGNFLYVGYGSMWDFCLFHGWLVGVPINNPASVTAWAAGTTNGTFGVAIWGVGGVASDGTNPFVTTGNTYNTGGVWSGGGAVIRFQSGPIFSGNSSDYWAPTNWLQLDTDDLDLGASGPLLVDVPGATPSHLVVAMGKDGYAYLLNRDNLGGISAPLASFLVNNDGSKQAAATYRTNQGTYVAFRGANARISAFRINPSSPPSITPNI